MEITSQHLSDSFSYGWLRSNAPPSLGRLDGADGAGSLGHSFNSSATSFIDMDPGELFSMRWTTPAASDFDFGLPGGPHSPLLVNADRIFSNGRLIPCEPNGRSCLQDEVEELARCDVIDVPGMTRSSGSTSPLFHSAQSTPATLSSCSSARSAAATKAKPRVARRCRATSPRKILLRYLRFLMPLYRKVRALRLFAPRPRVSPASPARGSTSSFTSSIDWCHGNADIAVHDAIMYCKKSIGQDI